MGAGTRCERCGTMVEAGRVICPNCDNVVDLSFLGEQTRGALEDDDDGGGSPFSESTLTVQRAALATTAGSGETDPNALDPEVPTLRVARPGTARPRTTSASSDPGAASAPRVRPGFLDENTEADLDDLSELLRSSTDALILGDAGDIVESLWVGAESLSSAGRPAFVTGIDLDIDDGVDVDIRVAPRPPVAGDDFLTAPTHDGVRDIIPVQVYVGADIARMIEKDAVLRRTAVDTSRLALSSFETFVLAQIDGARPVARIQKRMGLGDADLRIALALLVDKKLVERTGRAASVNDAGPAPIQPRAPSTTPSPAPLPRLPTPPLARVSLPMPAAVASPAGPGAASTAPGFSAPPRTGLVVDDAGRSRAAALHAQCLRDLKNGAVARAYAVARMAHDAAPDEPRYKEILEDWNAFVSAHKTDDDARLHAQAVSAENAGDVVRAVALLKSAVAANPRNAAVWNRLGLLLATRMNDTDGALDAMTRAIELSPEDPTFKNNFGKIAALSERRGSAPTSKGGLFGRLFRR